MRTYEELSMEIILIDGEDVITKSGDIVTPEL